MLREARIKLLLLILNWQTRRATRLHEELTELLHGNSNLQRMISDALPWTRTLVYQSGEWRAERLVEEEGASRE